MSLANSVNEFAIVSALIKYITIISLMDPGAAGNALQKKKPDIIRLGLIDMINTQTLMLITLMKFVKLKTYLKIALGITLKI